MFKIREFIDEITLFKQGASVDALGFAIETMAENTTFFGKVMTEKGKDFIAGNVDTSRHAISVLTHFRNDVAPKDEIEWQSQRYEVVGVIPHEMKNELQINAIFTEARPAI